MPDGTAGPSGSAFGAVVAAAQGRETANGRSASQAQLLSRFAAALEADRLRHPPPPPPPQQPPQQQQQQLSPHQLSRTCTELRIDTAIERARSARARREALAAAAGGVNAGRQSEPIAAGGVNAATASGGVLTRNGSRGGQSGLALSEGGTASPRVMQALALALPLTLALALTLTVTVTVIVTLTLTLTPPRRALRRR